MKPKIILSILLSSLTLWAGTLEVGGIRLPTQQDDFKLQGAGLLRKGFIFKIYVGALYLQNEEHVDEVLGAVPKRLDIHYFHHTPKKHMIRVAEETLKKNLTKEQYEKLLPMIGKLHDAYLNGQKSSVASLIYQPGEGLTYAFDDRIVITIPDDEFANAYFKIWLGEEPSSPLIKEAMLQGG
ncbi:chalcone isomerase family protein [Pontiellaceae bacterium B1224]|nr:chalcone isomerase family protein [Pontiellaceae bacterium B1224]